MTRYPSLALLSKGPAPPRFGSRRVKEGCSSRGRYSRADERMKHLEGLHRGWQNGECARKLQEIEGLATLDATFKAGRVAS